METFVGDTITLKLQTGVDTSVYNTKKIKYVKPDGSSGSWTASTCPEDNTVVQYAVSDNLNLRGTWFVQAYIEHGGEKFHGKWAEFKVFSSLPLS